MSASVTPTLLEDWQERRRRVSDSAQHSEHAKLLRSVLDYLIKRYGQAPEAQRTAKFPAVHQVYVNERVMLVYHHVGQHIVGGVKSAQEAQERVTTIVHRLAAREGSKDSDLLASAPPPDETAEGGEEDIEDRRRAYQLYQRIVNHHDRRAAGKLAVCHPRSAADYTLRAWHHYVATYGPGGMAESLADVLRLPELRDRVLDPIRLFLADPNPRVRTEALRLLGEIGELDDIGLLMDLLDLPPSADEAPGERETMMRTINRLSGCAEPEPEPEIATYVVLLF